MMEISGTPRLPLLARCCLRCRRTILRSFFQTTDAFPNPAPVDFQFCLPGAPAADAAGKSAHGFIFCYQSRQQIFELGQFYLIFTLPGLGSLGKNVQDQLGPVYHLQIDGIGNGADLGGTELLIEYQERYLLLKCTDGKILKFAQPP